MTAAIVIARGGSKRLPRKNVKPFCGLPLVAWSIIQAKCSRLVDWVFLSTDDDEIEAIGKEYGAEIIRRPDWSDADQVSANRVFIHALEVIAERDYDMPVFVSILPTVPLCKPDDIDKGIEHFHRVGSEHVWPAVKRRETTIYKNILDMKAKLLIWDKSYMYLEGNSGLYNVMSTAWYRWHYPLLTKALGDHDKALDGEIRTPMEYPDADGYYIECEPWQLCDVDTEAEFETAEVLMEHYILKGRGPEVYYEYAKGNA